MDAILFEDRRELTKVRIAENARLIAVVDADILLHLFNHQTHHRGQAHACLSILTGGEPPSLDLLAFQRGATAPSLEKLIQS